MSVCVAYLYVVYVKSEIDFGKMTQIAHSWANHISAPIRRELISIGSQFPGNYPLLLAELSFPVVHSCIL